jgi:hypothetical protein
VLFFDLRVLRGNLVEHLVKQAVGELHDVVLREAGHLFPAVPGGILERVADNPLAAAPGDHLEALDLIRRVLVLDARVEVLLVLAHDDDIHRRVLGRDVRVVGHARTHVRVEPQQLTCRDVQALEPAALRGCDGRLQEDLGPQQAIQRALLDARRVAAEVDLLADFNLLDLQPRARLLEDGQRRVHDLRTDAVALGDCNCNFLF